MLALVFEVSGEKFAVPASRVVSVIRRPVMRRVTGVPAWVAGLFLWADAWAPVVDLSQLISGVPCPEGAAIRIAIVEHARGTARRPLGLLAPGMTRVTELSATSEGIHVLAQPFLGGIANADDHGIQLLDIERILPGELDALLFGQAASGMGAG